MLYILLIFFLYILVMHINVDIKSQISKIDDIKSFTHNIFNIKVPFQYNIKYNNIKL